MTRTKSTVDNKPLAFMTADVKTQASVLRKNISDYPQCLEIETATNASAKTLGIIFNIQIFLIKRIWIF